MSDGLETLFSPPQDADLRRLINLLLPALNGLPSGVTAGVPFYVSTALSGDRADWLTAHHMVLDSIAAEADLRRSKFWAIVDDNLATAILLAVQARLPDDFRRVRDLAFEGYFAHPRWRCGLGKEIWSRIGFRPVLRPQDQFTRDE